MVLFDSPPDGRVEAAIGDGDFAAAVNAAAAKRGEAGQEEDGTTAH